MKGMATDETDQMVCEGQKKESFVCAPSIWIFLFFILFQAMFLFSCTSIRHACFTRKMKTWEQQQFNPERKYKPAKPPKQNKKKSGRKNQTPRKSIRF